MRVFRLFSLAIAGLLLVPALPARADDAQALLAKHKAFVGWQYGDGAFTSLVLDRTLTDEKGAIVQRATDRRAGLVYRHDYTGEKATFAGSTGFTGNVFWETNRNGFTVPVVGDDAKYYLAADVLFMEGTTELPSELRTPATVSGRTVPVVRVTMHGAEPIDLYVDPDTGAYVRAVIDPGGTEETTFDIHSYMTIAPGKKMIGSWSLDGSKAVYAYTKPVLNGAVATTDFHPPAPSAAWTFKNDQPFPIRVTQDRMYVNASVNGVPGRFLIDTGAGEIALTDDFADRAHVRTTGHGFSETIGGVAKTLIRSADTIEIGGNVLSNVVVSTFNNKIDDRNYHETVDGLVGFDIFAGTLVDLNLSNSTMRIRDGATELPSIPGGVPIIVSLTQGVPVVPMQLEGKVDVNATLDTGNPDIVLISRDVRDHGIAMVSLQGNGFLNSNAVIEGVGGQEDRVYCGTLDKITLGPLVYTGMSVCESYQQRLHDALVGFDFLKHFDYIFDYPRSEIIMIPHKD